MQITVRVGEDKSNSNNLREIAKMGFGEKKRSEDREMTSSILNGNTSFGEQREEWTRSSTTGSGVSIRSVLSKTSRKRRMFGQLSMIRKTSSLVTSIDKDNVSSVWPRACRRGITPPRTETDDPIPRFFSCLSSRKPEIKLYLISPHYEYHYFRFFSPNNSSFVNPLSLTLKKRSTIDGHMSTINETLPFL